MMNVNSNFLSRLWIRHSAARRTPGWSEVVSVSKQAMACWTLAIMPVCAFALPDTDNGLAIGGVIVDESTGEPLYDLQQSIPAVYVGQIEPNVFFQCTTSFTLQTGSSTNSFFHNVDLTGCPALVGLGGSYSLFGEISTTLSSEGEELIEVVRFSRSTPNAPITILFEPFGFNHLGTIEVTPRIVDQDGTELFVGSTVSATTDGEIGPVGSPVFSVVLEGVPDDIVGANVTRSLELTLQAQFNVRTLVPFPLTYAGAGGCVELLHVGPAEAAPAARNATFGCPTQVPPSNCLDETTEAIASARLFNRATREVRRNCGRKMNEACGDSLGAQLSIFNQLLSEQSDIQVYCIP